MKTLALVSVLSLVAGCSGKTHLAEDPPDDPRRSGGLVFKKHHIEELDLLFVIDNSASMADKQSILAAAVPDLVERLANPVCIDQVHRNEVGSVDLGAECRDVYPGSEPAFRAIEDIHIGVITSSLGGSGADSCSPHPSFNTHENDRAHLIARGKDSEGQPVAVDTTEAFLDWHPGDASGSSNPDDLDQFVEEFTHRVRGAEQDGCGFEGSLEAWYRFLVDPAPFERMVPAPCFAGDTSSACRAPEGIDLVVLQQRADFQALR